MSTDFSAQNSTGKTHPAFLTPRKLMLLFAVAAALLYVSAKTPVIALALIGAVGGIYFAIRRPSWLLGFCFFSLVVIPSYIRLPVLPGLPAFPVSLTALFLLLGVLALTLAVQGRGEPLGPRGRRIVLAFAVFAFIAFCSLFDERTRIDSVDFFIKIFLVPSGFAYAILWLTRDLRPLEKLSHIFVIGAVCTVFYGLHEYIAGTNVLLDIFKAGGDDDEWYWRGGDFAAAGVMPRGFSVFTNPIEFGTLLSMAYPYALLQSVSAQRRLHQVLWFAAAALLLLGIGLSLSRGPMLAIGVITLLMAYFVKPLRKLMLYGTIFMALAGAAAFYKYGHLLEDRLKDQDNVSLRVTLWQIALNMAKDHPLTGVGLGNFPYYQHETIRKHYINTIAEPNAERITTSENVYLQTAAEMGALGLGGLALCALAYLALVRWLWRRTLDPTARKLLLASFCAVLAYFINGLTIAAYQHYIITVTLGFLIASAMVIERQTLRETA